MSGVYSSLFVGGSGCGRKLGGVGRGYTGELFWGQAVWGKERELRDRGVGGCGSFTAPLHCSRLPRALPTDSALHVLPPPPPGSLGPSSPLPGVAIFAT